MTTPRTLFLLSALLSLALPCPAQFGPGGTGGIGGLNVGPDGNGRLGTAHFAPMPGAMTRTVSGEMTGDHLGDAVVLVGNQPVFLFNAGLHHALTDLPAKGHEIACLRAGAQDGRDALLLASANRRLELWTPNLREQTFHSEPLGTIAWVGVTDLRTGDLNGDGAHGIVGLPATRDGLLVLQRPRGVPELRLWTSYTIYSFELIEWDGAPGLELALMTSEGMKVCDFDLQVLWQNAAGGPGDRIAVIHQPSLGHDRLVGCIQGGATVFLYTADATTIDPPISLGGATLTALATGDFDADGQEDLLISHQTTGELALFTNSYEATGASFSWDPGTWALYDLTEDGSGSAPAPWNEATPIFVDLDLDGDADVLHPVEKDDAIVLMRSSAVDHEAYAPLVGEGCYQLDEDTGESRVTLQVVPPPLAPSVDDAIEVVLWRQPDALAPTDPVPVSLTTVPLTAWPLEVVLTFTEPQPSSAIFHAQMRLVALDGTTGEVVDAGPCIVHSLTRSLSTRDELVDLHGVDPEEVVVLGTSDLENPCNTTPFQQATPQQATLGGTQRPDARTPGGYVSATGDEGSSSVPLTCVPCFTDGWIPWGI